MAFQIELFCFFFIGSLYACHTEEGMMEDQARAILGNLVYTRFQLGHNFTEILNVLEDTVAAAVVQSVISSQSHLVGNKSDDVFHEFSQRVRGKIRELEGVIRLEIEAQAAARAREEGKS